MRRRSGGQRRSELLGASDKARSKERPSFSIRYLPKSRLDKGSGGKKICELELSLSLCRKWCVHGSSRLSSRLLENIATTVILQVWTAALRVFATSPSVSSHISTVRLPGLPTPRPSQKGQLEFRARPVPCSLCPSQPP